jgi:hypothetical protein
MTAVLLAQIGLVADTAARAELAEDITARAGRPVRQTARADRCARARPVAEPAAVLEVEADLVTRIARRAAQPAHKVRIGGSGLVRVDPTQAAVVGALAGAGPLVVLEGVAIGEHTGAAWTRRSGARVRMGWLIGRVLFAVRPRERAVGDHPSGTTVAGRLVQSTRGYRAGRPSAQVLRPEPSDPS